MTAQAPMETPDSFWAGAAIAAIILVLAYLAYYTIVAGKSLDELLRSLTGRSHK